MITLSIVMGGPSIHILISDVVERLLSTEVHLTQETEIVKDATLLVLKIERP